MKVFISYRRADSQWPADRIYEALKQVIPASDIFLDIDKIPLGVDFRKYIDGRVAECDVLVALIGPSWLDIQQDESGQRRLDDPNDFVRLEIASALTRGIPVIPVLLDGATMPAAASLPSDLTELSTRNAVDVRRSTFESDVTRLVRGLALPAQIMERRTKKLSRRAIAVLALLGWIQFTAIWLWAGVTLWSEQTDSLSEALFRTVAALRFWDPYYSAEDLRWEFVRYAGLLSLGWLIVLVFWRRLSTSLRSAWRRWAVWITLVLIWLSLGVYYWRDLPPSEAVYRTLASLAGFDVYFNADAALLIIVGWLGSLFPVLTLLIGFWDSVRRSLAETFLEG